MMVLQGYVFFIFCFFLLSLLGGTNSLNRCEFLFLLSFSCVAAYEDYVQVISFSEKYIAVLFSCCCKPRFVRMLLVAELRQKEKQRSVPRDVSINVTRIVLVLMLKSKCRYLSWALGKPEISYN